jgi:hypothetical protein
MNRCPACVHVMKKPSSVEWHIAVGPWSIVDACCVMNLVSVVQLRGCLLSFIQISVQETLNTLIWIQMIWSTEPTWNMCIIWFFSSVINLNKQRSNETLVGAVIRDYDLQDRRRACYQLSHAACLWSRLVVPLKKDKYVRIVNGPLLGWLVYSKMDH